MKMLRTLSIMTIFILPLSAQAFSTLEMTGIYGWVGNTKECAVQTEFVSAIDGLINGLEQIEINDTDWGGLDQLPSFSGYSAGFKVSYGTLSLQLRANYNFDVILDESICENLQNGDVITSTNSGGEITQTFSLDDIMLQSGYVLNTNNIFDHVDLDQNSIQIESLDGSILTLGTGPLWPTFNGGGGDSGGGCSLIASAIPAGSSLAFLFGANLFLLGAWRRFKK